MIDFLLIARLSFLNMIELMVFIAVVIGFKKNMRVLSLESSIASTSF